MVHYFRASEGPYTAYDLIGCFSNPPTFFAKGTVQASTLIDEWPE